MFVDRLFRFARLGMLLSATLPVHPLLAFSFTGTSDNPGGIAEVDLGLDIAGDLQYRQEPWEFVSIPRFGIAPLQEVLEVGSAANLAWLSVGEPIDRYLSVPLYAPHASVNNGASLVYMLPERCLGDLNNNGHIDFDDAILFAIAYLNGDRAADLSGDGFIDIRDQILFLHLATIPCFSAW